MHVAEVIASGFEYPTPDSLQRLAEDTETSTHGAVKRHLERFIAELEKLSMGEWEELHTSTLDLSPLFVPYVGHVAWGENYRRGEFMADLNAAMRDERVDLHGELPDHIAPVLRYLSVAAEPRQDLIDELPSAVETMAKTLSKASADNPYRHLMAAVVDFTADLQPLKIGAKQ